MLWSPGSHSRHSAGSSFVRSSLASALAARRRRAPLLSLERCGWTWFASTSVNETIKPLTDLEHWGVIERWSYPDDGYGDCEDYVLLKRRMPIQSGWPREALLVTVVRDKKYEGHAVLTVTTDKGDYVLDNQNEDILLWSKTGYRFVKRQSQSNPNVWVSLDDSQPAIGTATAR
jgi:predicted transglutaminase-like cysteine proteinase